MNKNIKLILTVVVGLLYVPIQALAGTGGILASSRSIDWSQAGVQGGIPNRTTVCATLNPGASVSQINSAIAGCPDGQVVYLNTGTYSLSGPIHIYKNNVTLRGAGPGQTNIIFSAGDSCNGLGSDLCIMNGDGSWSGGPDNTADWTSGFSQGATQITLSNTTNLKVGSLLTLDQLDDSNDTGNGVWVCGSTPCSDQGNTASGRPGRGEQQRVMVTGISGNTVTFTPGLYSPNWRSSQNPGAWWGTMLPITGVGVENMTLDHRTTSGQNGSGVMFNEATNSWVKNVRSLNGTSGNAIHKHVWMFQSSHITIRDSYFYGSNSASESYGADCTSSSDNLIENNIFQHIASAEMNEGASGCVFGYNYAVDNNYNNGAPNWQQNDSYHHSAGDHMLLWEGNMGSGLLGDDIHGSSWMNTAFRNRWTGRDTGLEYGAKTQSTNGVHLFATNRSWNVVGNVVGTVGYHTIYSWEAKSTTDAGDSNSGDLSVFNIGYSGGEGTHGGFNNDLLVASTLLRWGNYDTVHGSVQWNTSEVPSSIALYANPVPSQTLPASFYLSGKPSWWPSSIPFPAIGPDVTGGNVPDVGGHVYYTPSANCYLNVMGGKTDGSSGALSFDAATCYNASTPTPTPTPSPTPSPAPSTPAIASSLSAAASINTPFFYQITASNGPIASYAATGLPPGLSVSSAGLISGTPTAAGSYAVTLKATNSGGTGTAILTITVANGADITPPSVPTSLKVVATTASTISLSWTASTDDRGVSGYFIYRNGTQVGSGAATTFTDANLTPGVAYTYTIMAYDAANNHSGASTPVTGTTMVSVSPPPPPTPTPIPTPTGASCSTNASNAWASQTFSGQTGNFIVSFDVTPNGNNIDGNTGLSLGGVITSPRQLAAIVGWMPDGTIKVFDGHISSPVSDPTYGGNFAAMTNVSYIAGQKYHFRFFVNTASKVYSVFVTLPGTTQEVELASNYGFRTNYAAPSSFDTMNLSSVNNSQTLCNLAIGGSSGTPTPAPTSTPTPTPIPLPSPSPTPPPVTSDDNQPQSAFTRFLVHGSKGAEVYLLQKLLIKDGDFPQAIVSGYFGNLTQAALQKFQTKYGIVSSGTPTVTGYGATGPATRVKLNALVIGGILN